MTTESIQKAREPTTTVAVRHKPQTLRELLVALLTDTRRTRCGEPWWIRARWIYLREWLLTRRLHRLAVRKKAMAGIKYDHVGREHGITAADFSAKLALILGIAKPVAVSLLWEREGLRFRVYPSFSRELIPRTIAVNLALDLAQHFMTCDDPTWGPAPKLPEAGGDIAMRKAGKAKKRGKGK